MLLIKKGKEPSSLTEYKTQSNAYYDGCNKSDIRKALLNEQGYLCAYCMKRISETSMTVEHYSTQSNISEKEALDYNNMLGVCLGNRGKGQKNLTCDAHRGNDNLTINPFLKASINLICYDGSGKIYSDDPEINKDLDVTLNLNCEQVLLKTNRKRALEALKKYLLSLRSKGTWKKEFLRRIKKKYESPNEIGKLEPYSGIILYYLNKKIR
ncbi:MAG: TIGR02646 family protein [Marinisporobacter sp.]|jgi:uncharacterized protein (TIGR02646 family)|nr:TIGR02646 family protein [Marinisporobacter sp.]